jgi:hypothetical protein
LTASNFTSKGSANNYADLKERLRGILGRKRSRGFLASTKNSQHSTIFNTEKDEKKPIKKNGRMSPIYTHDPDDLNHIA